jgi:signal peptidase I
VSTDWTNVRRRTGLISLTALGLIIAGLRGNLRRYEVAKASMEPQLSPGDYVIAQRRSSALARGDIVIVPHPEISGFDLVKRVIGLPGETITLSNGQVHVDGRILPEPWAEGPARPDGEWVLDERQAFVLGDNRPVSSADSRTIGAVNAQTIEWKVVGRYWPLRAVGRVSSASGR